MRKSIFLKNSIISKDHINSFISSISNDVMVNNLISDLINRSGVTNFFWTDSGFYYSLRTDSEFIGIFVDNNNIYVSNNMDGICQQIRYENSVDGSVVTIDNSSRIDIHNNCLYRDVKFKKVYDSSGKVVFESKVVDTRDSNNDPDENCCSIISKFFFDDEIIKAHSMSYYFKPYLNNTKYFVIRNNEQLVVDSSEFDRLSTKVKRMER